MVSANQLFEILLRYTVHALNQTQDPGDLLSVLVRERVEEFLDGAFSTIRPVEFDGPHEEKLTYL
jgi:hypothetical protein